MIWTLERHALFLHMHMTLFSFSSALSCHLQSSIQAIATPFPSLNCAPCYVLAHCNYSISSDKCGRCVIGYRASSLGVWQAEAPPRSAGSCSSVGSAAPGRRVCRGRLDSHRVGSDKCRREHTAALATSPSCGKHSNKLPLSLPSPFALSVYQDKKLRTPTVQIRARSPVTSQRLAF